jgi:hypothetical protein
MTTREALKGYLRMLNNSQQVLTKKHKS